MNKILAIVVLLAFLPVCTGLNCYVCSSGLTGCNDPFDGSNSNVTKFSLSANIYCAKQGLTSSVISRYGSPSCSAISFVFGIGQACCSTDLCNGAPANYKMPAALVILTICTMLFKFY